MLYNMKELLEKADENGFAVPAFNISSYGMFNGIMDISERLNAPVIIEIHPNELKHIGTDVIAAFRARASESKIPVCIHLDHGASYENIMTAVRAGFTSVMIDASSLPYEENVVITRKVAEAAHAAITYTSVQDSFDPRMQEDRAQWHYAPSLHCGNISVEGELGNIGSIDECTGKVTEGMHFTEPEEAVCYIRETGIDCLAVGIGTSHGLYPKGFLPHIQIDRLKAIRKAIKEAGLETFLVLHGGSGNPKEELTEAAQNGVTKINISSDIKKAYYSKMKEVLQDDNLREPNEIEPACIQAMQAVAAERIKWFGADGKGHLYR
ncbi:MAG: class II fructose-bisphosphate aldolase [Eubacteriales bacterium]|nr:class II fructose-bisphosphate aldolase [Eubacteriales bacterium]